MRSSGFEPFVHEGREYVIIRYKGRRDGAAKRCARDIPNTQPQHHSAQDRTCIHTTHRAQNGAITIGI
jgi:hypothetical protein